MSQNGRISGQSEPGIRYIPNHHIHKVCIMAVNLVSAVSFLKAKPNKASFLLVTVLKSEWMIWYVKRRFWNSFISITCKRTYHLLTFNQSINLIKIIRWPSNRAIKLSDNHIWDALWHTKQKYKVNHLDLNTEHSTSQKWKRVGCLEFNGAFSTIYVILCL